MIITHTFVLAMGHRLQKHAGKCKNFHGHNYDIAVSVGGAVDPATGFVIDFSDLKRRVKAVLEPFDHAMVLEIHDTFATHFPGKKVILNVPPSAENLSSLWFNLFYDEGLTPIKVTVHEMPDSFAEVTSVNRSIRLLEAVHG